MINNIPTQTRIIILEILCHMILIGLLILLISTSMNSGFQKRSLSVFIEAALLDLHFYSCYTAYLTIVLTIYYYLSKLLFLVNEKIGTFMIKIFYIFDITFLTMNLFVVGIFWPFYLIDRKGILTLEESNNTSYFLTLVLHTVPLIMNLLLVFLNRFLINHLYYGLVHSGASFCVNVIYFIILIGVLERRQRLPYPILYKPLFINNKYIFMGVFLSLQVMICTGLSFTLRTKSFYLKFFIDKNSEQQFTGKYF